MMNVYAAKFYERCKNSKYKKHMMNTTFDFKDGIVRHHGDGRYNYFSKNERSHYNNYKCSGVELFDDQNNMVGYINMFDESIHVRLKYRQPSTYKDFTIEHNMVTLIDGVLMDSYTKPLRPIQCVNHENEVNKYKKVESRLLDLKKRLGHIDFKKVTVKDQISQSVGFKIMLLNTL